MDFIPQYYEVPGFFALSADDARPNVVGIALAGKRWRSRYRRAEEFGRVPFFYYVLHIPLIHIAAIIVSLLRTGSVAPWLFMNHPVMNPPSPPGYVWNIGLLYLVWLIVVTVLYIPCRWYAALKQRRKDIGFLRYL